MFLTMRVACHRMGCLVEVSSPSQEAFKKMLVNHLIEIQTIKGQNLKVPYNSEILLFSVLSFQY